MKIAMVSFDASPLTAEANSRGQRVATLAAALAQQRHEVTVYAGNSDPALPEQATMSGYAVSHLPSNAEEFADKLVAQWEMNTPDVVHAQSWASSLVSATSAGEAGVAVVLTAPEPDEMGTWPAPVERALCQVADQIIATSERRAVALIRAGVWRTRVRVVPPGVDTGLFSPDGPSAARTLTHRVVWLGEPWSPKGFDVSGFVADTEFQTIGGSAPALSAPERAALLRSADVAVCAGSSADQESLTLEAMSCGVPVVVLVPDGPGDMVVHSITGIQIPQDNALVLIRTLRSLVADATQRDMLGMTARDRANVRYSWDRIADETALAYERARNARGTCPSMLSNTFAPGGEGHPIGMGTDDKLDAKGDQLKGKLKEGVGDATDDQGLQAEGKTDQAKGHLKEAAEKVKDVFKKD